MKPHPTAIQSFLLATCGAIGVPLSAQGSLTTMGWQEEGTQLGANLGDSVSAAGDVNGDGYDDMIVGASGHADGTGRIYLYLGSLDGPSTPLTFDGDQAGAYFGFPVAAAGDVNGDGNDDVLVGASSYSNGEPGEGRAYLFLGSRFTGLNPTPFLVVESDQAGAALGFFLSGVGDVNADGYADVVVSSFRYDGAHVDEGLVDLYIGGLNGMTRTWTAEGNVAGAWFGAGVGRAGDVNGDGRDDVLVGSSQFARPEVSEGRVQLFLADGVRGLEDVPVWGYESDQAFATLGWSVVGGDVNGDGYSDVLVGADWYDNVESNEGRAYLFLASSGVLPPAPTWTAEGNQRDVHLGDCVAMADVNADGYADLLVGSRGLDNAGSFAGRGYLYLGSAGGPVEPAAWTGEGGQAGATFANVIGGAGDVNGDGYEDVIVGEPLYDAPNAADAGRAHLFYGLPEACTAQSQPIGMGCGPSLQVSPPTMGLPSSTAVGQARPLTPVVIRMSSNQFLPPPSHGCQLILGFPQLVAAGTTDAAGAFAATWTIPLDPSLCGRRLILQGSILPPPTGSFRFRQIVHTNAVQVTIGS
jgi:hypothetical protein